MLGFDSKSESRAKLIENVCTSDFQNLQKSTNIEPLLICIEKCQLKKFK